MSFQHEPTDPLGNGPLEIFMRQLKRWTRQFIVWDIKGAKCIPHPNGGRTFVLPTLPGTPAPAKQTVMHPFKIYQPTNYASFKTGIVFLGNDGTPTVCNIDATKPTDFGATPPTVNPSESWRFWAVRAGIVDIRPIYSLPVSSTPWVDWSMGAGFGVYENTDGIIAGSNITFDDPTTETIYPPLIIKSDFGKINQFWLKIVMDTDALDFPVVSVGITEYEGLMGDYDFTIATRKMIPIGQLWPTYDFSNGQVVLPYYVVQEIFDNVTGRFPPGNGNFASGGVMNFRGTYDFNTDECVPDDLTDQVFYPGDCVTIYNGVEPSGTKSCQIFQFNSAPEFPAGESPGFWSGNPNRYGGWVQIFGTVSAP